MIDVASGGALEDMTPAEARKLIEKMASNSQQFSARNDAIVIRGVHEVATNSSTSSKTKKLEGKLDAREVDFKIQEKTSRMTSN